MKATVVPAQITTIEDKIAGNLSMSQLLLLAAPVFIGAVIFIIFPPFLDFEPYKLVLLIVLALVSSCLAVRVKGKILLLWIVVIVRYNLRPKYYIFDKNDVHLRVQFMASQQDDEVTLVAESSMVPEHESISAISLADAVKLEQLLANSDTNVSFRPGRKGGIDVLIAEVER